MRPFLGTRANRIFYCDYNISESNQVLFMASILLGISGAGVFLSGFYIPR